MTDWLCMSLVKKQVLLCELWCFEVHHDAKKLCNQAFKTDLKNPAHLKPDGTIRTAEELQKQQPGAAWASSLAPCLKHMLQNLIFFFS
jgi:hypothetical protein